MPPRRIPIALASVVTLAFVTGSCGSGADPQDGTQAGEGEAVPGEEEHAVSSQQTDPHGAGATHAGEPNRLIHEKSPYLLQHAYNPVDWHPWGEEALSLAKELDKPILLSVGYSTCHWCHVMERESFEDAGIAALMNQHFVCIKVDREERPDVDQLYMSAVQAMVGRGGWPMTVFMTPELEPFFAGTYFPPDDRLNRPGFRSLLNQLGTAWVNDRVRVEEYGARVRDALERQASTIVESSGDGELGVEIFQGAFDGLEGRFDAVHGGFGTAPKFPSPHQLTFLLRHAKRSAPNRERALEMVRTTLDAMAGGGIHDHLGGGFHRYSTDPVWLAPHFEKMLYDQAGLGLAYTECWLTTGEAVYRRVAEGIMDYVLTYMTHPDGGFYSAEDADSEGEEGTFYVWSVEEIDEVLGTRAQAFRETYDVTATGNWEHTNILHTSDLAPLLDAELAADRKKLLEVRDRRMRPHLDDKVVTAWNGFMIEAMARAGRAFGEPRYVAGAARAADFVLAHLWKDGRLLRHYRDGASGVAGYLDDYAFLGRGLVALYETTFEPRWLEAALEIAAPMEGAFGDTSGIFRFTPHDGEKLLAPVIEVYDGAMPSGNAVAAGFLLRLGHLVADGDIEQRGWKVLDGLSGVLTRSPTGMLEAVNALDFALGPVTELVIAGEADDPVLRSMWEGVRTQYLPNLVVARRPVEKNAPIVLLIPYLEAQVAIDGRATAYVCRNYACQLPVHEADALLRQLEAN